MSDIDQRGQTVQAQTNYIVEQAPRLLNLHQIGEPVGDFVGRSQEIDDLLAAFNGTGKRGAVISGLHGMGGVGKTELAKVLANRLKEHFPDAQIAFNLRGARDDDSSNPATPIEALQHVIRAFLPEARLPEDTDSLRGLYHSVLDGKRVLLLMDNALEARQLAGLTPLPDGCGLMVTSRHHFALSNMMDFNLDTLSPQEARKLLLEICPRIGVDGEADTLATLCGRLPLALRLAASALARRLNLRGEEHFEEYLKNYCKDLRNEKKRLSRLDAFKDKSDVERGIEASLAISYRLLDERLQRYWRALAVFPGDFDWLAAGSVWQLSDPEESDIVLDDLLAASMVQCERITGRFRLHDLARDFASAQLSQNEHAGDAQRHAAHYLAVLRRTTDLNFEGGDAVLQGFALFDLEWDNIRAGQAWAAANSKKDNIAASLCTDYPYAGFSCLGHRLHPRERIVWLGPAIEAARNLGDRVGELANLDSLGYDYNKIGERNRAIECLEQALDIAREIGGPNGVGVILNSLGLVYADLGDTLKAIEYHKQSLSLSRDIKDQRSEGISLGNLGRDYAQLGKVDKAIECHVEQLAIARKIGNLPGEGNALHNLAYALAKIGRRKEAIDHAENAVKIYEQIKSPHAAEARARLEELRSEKREV